MDKLKVALIGIGGMGGAHYNCYKSAPNAEVVAVCDVRKEMAEQKTAADNIRVYDDMDVLLQNETPDIVDICLPSYLHANAAIKFLEKGFNVFCEKPLALNEEDCKRVLKAVESSGKKFMVGHVVRFKAPYIYLSEAIKSGKLGNLLSLELRRISSIPIWSWNNWMRDESLSGGVCVDLAIHDIDFVQSVLGKPDAISATYRPITDNSSVIKYEMTFGKTTVHGEGAWYNADIPFTADFLAVFDNGYIELKDGKLIENKQEVSLEEHASPVIEGLNISGDNSNVDELVYFADCVINDKTPDFITGESSAYSVKLASDLVAVSKKI